MSEKTAPLGIKVLVVLLSIGLASGYVYFRKQSSSPTKPPITKVAGNPEAETNEEADPPAPDPVIMSSSKSERLPTVQMTEELRKVLMSSSKSGIIIPPQDVEEAEDKPKSEEPIKPRPILPSSKSIQLVEPQPSQKR